MPNPSLAAPQNTPLDVIDVPRFIVKELEVTATLDTGVAYLAKVKKPLPADSFLHNVKSDLVVVKLNYPGFGLQRYGQTVHTFLAENDMAPQLYVIKSPIPKLFAGQTSLERYVYMEYLAPPSDSSPNGWISLYDLGMDHFDVASANKDQILQALKEITKTLQQKQYVHGDFRPNNLLIYVKIVGSICTLIPRPNTKEPFIKVIDFDWSGRASSLDQPNNIRYPPHRNPKVIWPGKDGEHIYIADDEIMISSWIKKWPPVNIRVAQENVENTVANLD